MAILEGRYIKFKDVVFDVDSSLEAILEYSEDTYPCVTDHQSFVSVCGLEMQGIDNVTCKFCYDDGSFVSAEVSFDNEEYHGEMIEISKPDISEPFGWKFFMQDNDDNSRSIYFIKSEVV